jgi:type I restriction enzyme S subunit
MSSKANEMTMTPVGKPTLTPMRRFPEFQYATGWEIKQFAKLFSIGNGRDHKHLASGDIPVYGSGGYMRSVDGYLYDGESVCIGRKGTINSPMFLTGKFWTVDTLFYTHSFNKCLPKFIFSIFQSIDWLKHNEAGGVPSLSKLNIEKIETAIPSLAEQHKIAECLSSADELINVQVRKLDRLKAHKKGLMRNLFPRGNETIPRNRFPEFKNAGEWKATVLGKLVELQSGFAFSSEYFGNRGKKLVTPKNFTKSGVGNFDGANSKYTTENVPSKFICSSGDLLVLLTDLTPTCELLGNPLEIAEKDGTVLLNQRVAKVEPISNSVIKPFLKQFFLTDAYKSVIVKTASGSTVKHTSNKIILNMPIVLPAPEEQQRIADCLTSVDDLVAAQTKKIAILKSHKKGLMQQLFPSLEEITL